MWYYERRERIKMWLKRKGRATCGELANIFGVSKNTILNDINVLTPVFPLTTYYGRNGGYEYRGDGSSELNARQTKFLYRYLLGQETKSNHLFVEVLEILEHAAPKDE